MADSRRTTPGFAERTRRNLELAKASFDSRKDFHVVTQLVNSLLGIVVVPWQRHTEEGEQDFELGVSQDLFHRGWPNWTFTGKDKGRESENLKALVGNLRIAAAHGHYTFSGNPDSRYLHEVTIKVGNGAPNSSPWSYEIRGDKLYDFCIKLSEYLENPSA